MRAFVYDMYDCDDVLQEENGTRFTYDSRKFKERNMNPEGRLQDEPVISVRQKRKDFRESLGETPTTQTKEHCNANLEN